MLVEVTVGSAAAVAPGPPAESALPPTATVTGMTVVVDRSEEEESEVVVAMLNVKLELERAVVVELENKEWRLVLLRKDGRADRIGG